jgi:hypothetical protein
MNLTPHLGRVWRRVGACMLMALLLSACALADSEQIYPNRPGRPSDSIPTGEKDSVFGPGGLNIFSSNKPDTAGGSGGGIGVNSFLWRASLDTLSFIPLNSADPFGGVIITDWYSAPDSQDERFKLTVYILDRRLRADGIKVAVFKQARDGPQQWLNAEVMGDTAIKLENAILVRARQLRLATLGE